jgi:hypothetical protein
MPSKKEYADQIKALEAEMETAPDHNDDDYVEVYRVKKSHLGKGAMAWLFADEEKEEPKEEEKEEEPKEEEKEEPKPKTRAKYFG